MNTFTWWTLHLSFVLPMELFHVFKQQKICICIFGVIGYMIVTVVVAYIKKIHRKSP